MWMKSKDKSAYVHVQAYGFISIITQVILIKYPKNFNPEI